MRIANNDFKLGYDLFRSEVSIRHQQTPPIVLIHGFGLDRSVWHPFVSEHLSDFMVILPDMRGHGESDAPQGPYQMDLMADDLTELLDTLDVDQAIVCGHSMGGYVCLALASQYPDRLAGLGLITTNADADNEDKRAGRYALIEEIKTYGAVAVADNLAPRLSNDPAVVKQSHYLISRTEPAGLIGALEGMAQRPDRAALLPEINVPALVVAGEDDQITIFEDAKSMAKSLPQGQFLGLQGAGHMPMVETPAALGKGLHALIQRVMGSFS